MIDNCLGVTAIGLGITGVSLLSTLTTISSLMSKALTDDSISDEEYSLILLKFETFTRMKEDLRIISKTSLQKNW